MRKAISLGFGVAKPWGDSDRYDFILSRGSSFWRVQVKSRWTTCVDYYVKAAGCDDKPYTAEQIDFLVIYIQPAEHWYILPISALKGRKRIYITSRRNNVGMSKYLNAWKLFL
jgi:hypothetical protein